MGKPVEPPRDYQAARQGMAVAARPERRFLKVTGRAPEEMLRGILTGRLPAELDEASRTVSWGAYPGIQVEVLRGEVAYSAMLTARGRMITDLRVLRGEGGGFLLDLSEAGLGGALAHFKRLLPPRLARVQDCSSELGMLTILGPGAVPLLVSATRGNHMLGGLGEEIAALAEGGEVTLRGAASGGIRVVRNGDVNAPAWDLVLPLGDVERLKHQLEEAGAVPISRSTLEVLRLERGRPAFGVDMDAWTIPVEAGIHLRAIDYKKGCYTGQEVIVRIRDRGKVSKQLRRLLLGDAPVPERGTTLHLPGRGASVGCITSACSSPAFGETLALGYVRRQVRPGEEVRVGGPEGFVGRVQALDAEGPD